jgi:CheY-like chemotaxis protein
MASANIPNAQITVRAVRENGSLRMEVQDNGRVFVTARFEKCRVSRFGKHARAFASFIWRRATIRTRRTAWRGRLRDNLNSISPRAGMKIRALIVDDEKPARDLIANLLRDERDIEVVGQASNSSEAIEAISRENPDLLFLDIRMPGADGFELLEQIDAPNRSSFLSLLLMNTRFEPSMFARSIMF